MSMPINKRSILHLLLSALFGHRTENALEQTNQHPPMPQRPTTGNRDAWSAYWKEQGQPWRTELEIDTKRQRYLTERRSIISDFYHGIYPFKEIKLDRADVEWLLATHENGRGPIDWSDKSQRNRKGLDLRGADLRKENLSKLPLSRMNGGTPLGDATDEQREAMIIHLEGADLSDAHLEGADLSDVHLEQATLNNAHLEQAHLFATHLEGAILSNAHLEGANLSDAHLEQAGLYAAHLEEAYLRRAHLEGAYLHEAHLKQANLSDAHLEQADLYEAHLEQADLREAHLEGAKLSGSFFDGLTNLNNVLLSNRQYGGISLVDIHWGDVNVAVVDWSSLTVLGDEQKARKRYRRRRRRQIKKDKYERLREFQTGVRANRQLAVVLQNQGLNEDAARFTYRAQLMQRKVFWYQGKFAQYLGSLFLYLIAGYGYRWWRSFVAYLFMIGIFATIYHQLGAHLAWNEAIVISMTAFHGRGFFPAQFHPGDPQALAAAIEAFVGLLIEVTFIATLTQRLFGK